MSKYSKLQLEKIITIQEIALKEHNRGAYFKWIYENIIKDRFFISKSTFDRYMGVNAKKEIKQLCEVE